MVGSVLELVSLHFKKLLGLFVCLPNKKKKTSFLPEIQLFFVAA